MRTNIYKDKIINLLKKNHLLSISDIHKKIANVDYSTVYRNIEQLVSNNQIRKVVFDKGNIMYELNKEKDNHDHFLCLDCGDVEEISVPLKNLPLSKKYTVSDLLVRGLCENCNQKV